MTERPYHGGDPGASAARFGAPSAGWLDLSTGVSPFPYPWAAPARDALTRLPTRAALDRLLLVAAGAYGASASAGIAAAPGSQALIQWLPRLRKQSDVAVISPTYGEHAATWRAAGHRVRLIRGFSEAGGADVVVFGQPNNPDGRLYAVPEILACARRLARRGGWVIVDEAFADVAPEASVVAHAHEPGLIVLRSFGKFFGLPGVRLGFAIAEPRLTARIAEAIGPWPIAGPTLVGATQALADHAWAEAARTQLASARMALDDALCNAGLSVAGGSDLFRLIEDRGADRLFAHLGRSGIFVRHFPERPRWLRFGIPDSAGLVRLRRALGARRQPA